MRAEPETQQHTSAGVVPAVVPSAPWRVAKVEALADFRLRVTFVDGLSGTVDLSGLVQSSKAGVFADLADAKKFAQVFVECGVVTWPGEIDLAPDAMHAAIEARGEWVLVG